jgi:hypothetical protein
MDVDDVLEPGERVIWRGRPCGWGLALGIRPAEGVVILAIIAFLTVALGVFLYPAAQMATWETAHPRPGRGSQPAWWDAASEAAFALGPVPGLIFTFATLWLPALIVVPLLIRALTVYAVTDRRAILIRGRAVESLRREHVLRSRPRGRSLEIDGTDGRKLRFEGIDDPEPARDALFGAL